MVRQPAVYLITGPMAAGKSTVARLLASGFERALLWGVVGTVVLWAIHGLVDSPYWKNDMAVEFWLVVAIQVAVVRALKGTETNPT